MLDHAHSLGPLVFVAKFMQDERCGVGCDVLFEPLVSEACKVE